MTEVSPRSPRGFVRSYGIKLGISLIITALFVWTFKRGGLPLVPPRSAFERVDVVSCVVYLAICIVWNLIRAVRWRHLLAPVAEVPIRRLIAASFIGYTAILILPLRAGEFVRPYLIREHDRISMAAATGTVAAERTIDGLFLTLVLGGCLQIAHPLSPLPDHIGTLRIPVAAVPFYAYTSLALFLGAFALMGLFYWRTHWGRLAVERTVGLISKKLAVKCADFVSRLADGLKFLPRLGHFGPFMIETALYWGLNGFSLWLLARACGLDTITLPQAFVVLGVLGVGIVVPAGPGLFGAFQASTYAALAMYFHDDVVLGPGAVFVFLLYLLQVSLQIGCGIVGLALERRPNVAVQARREA